MKDGRWIKLAHFCKSARFVHEQDQFLDVRLRTEEGWSGSVLEDWLVVCVVITLVEDVFPGLEYMLDI